MLTKEEKLKLENKLYHIIKESFFSEMPYENEKKENSSDDDDEDEGRAEEKFGIRVIPDGDEIDIEAWNRIKTILPVLQDTNDDSVNSFNLTRSQIAYELWPDIEKDTARSKFSQKLDGHKAWKEWELNRIANIISGNLA
jgi:hypothetical protein